MFLHHRLDGHWCADSPLDHLESRIPRRDNNPSMHTAQYYGILLSRLWWNPRRALLLQGHVLKSLYYHPIVVYTAIFGSWFMISQTIQRLSKGKIAIGMRYRDIYLWIALGLVLANCLIKNLVLAMTGYTMM